MSLQGISMLFEDAAKSYPNLVRALNILARGHSGREGPKGVAAVVVLTIVAFFCLRLVALHPVLSVVPLALAGLVGFLYFKGVLGRGTVTPRVEEAAEVAQKMGQMLAKRRLHRDLDAGSLTLLDECARQWLRTQAVLDGPFWKSRSTPEHYRNVRSQALAASNDAMIDALLYYRDFVPTEIENRHALDYVDEALDNFVKGGASRGRREDRYPPSVFEPVRAIAERLRAVADETERTATENQQAVSGSGGLKGRPSLDETLSNLKEIRQAEEELRQNLRG